jgi:hypothetical protein
MPEMILMVLKKRHDPLFPAKNREIFEIRFFLSLEFGVWSLEFTVHLKKRRFCTDNQRTIQCLIPYD